MKRQTKPQTLPLGTISEGTLRPEDLIPEILDALDGLRISRADRKSVREISKAWDAFDPERDYPEDEEIFDASEALAELEEIAGAYAPAFCYFGSHEGDGALLGVWISWDSIRDAEREGEIVNSRERARMDQHSALEVNDHGNATLFQRAGAGRAWREVWSVV